MKTPQTANKVFDPVVSRMLHEAQHRFECLIFVDNAYPTIDTQIGWSTECWEAACVDSRTFFDLSKAMRTLVSDLRCLPVQNFEHVLLQIKEQCSHARGVVLQRVRTVVEQSFGLDVNKSSVVTRNKEVSRALLDHNAFYFAVRSFICGMPM